MNSVLWMGSILWIALTIPAITRGGVGKMEFFWCYKVTHALECIEVRVGQSLTYMSSLDCWYQTD